MNFNELLIEEVRKNACLYDASSKEYRNVQKKDEIWDEVATTLNSSADTCRKRWKTLRDAYKKNKRASGSNAPYPKKRWKFTDTLSFLDSYKDSRHVEPYDEDMSELDDSESAIFSGNAHRSTPKIPSRQRFFIDSDSTNSSALIPCVTLKTGKPCKKRTDAELTATFTKMMEKYCGTIRELASVETKRSTFLLFESLAKKITDSKLSEDDTSAIEAKVVSVVYEEISKCRKKTK